LTILGGVGYGVLRVLLCTRRSAPEFLHEDLPSLVPLYGEHRLERYYMFAIPLSAAFLRALFIAFAKGSASAQIALMLIVEIFTLVAVFVLKPGKTRRADVLSIYLGIVRVVCTGLLIAFVESVAVKPIPRVALGIVTAVIWSVTVVVMFFNILSNLGLPFPRRRRGRFSSLRSGSRNSSPIPSLLDQEKQENENLPEDGSIKEHGRRNPTPSKLQPLDPRIIEPYPDVTPQTTTVSPPSASTETTYGEQIESRWRGMSPPPSVSSPSFAPTPQSSAFGSVPSSAHGHARHPSIPDGRAV
jgi:hypothetical protein